MRETTLLKFHAFVLGSLNLFHRASGSSLHFQSCKILWPDDTRVVSAQGGAENHGGVKKIWNRQQ